MYYHMHHHSYWSDVEDIRKIKLMSFRAHKQWAVVENNPKWTVIGSVLSRLTQLRTRISRRQPVVLYVVVSNLLFGWVTTYFHLGGIASLPKRFSGEFISSSRCERVLLIVYLQYTSSRLI